MHAVRQIGKILKWLLIIPVALVVIVIGCWLLIPDQQLHPDAKHLLDNRSAAPSEQNAYFMLWGLPASPELDAHAVGRQIVAAHEQQVAAHVNLADFKPAQFFGAAPLLLKLSSRRCDIDQEHCLHVYQGMREQVALDTTQYAVYLARYRMLRTYPQFSEKVMTATTAALKLEYGPIVTLSNLVDAAIALQMQSPATRRAALDELTKEITLWRRFLQDSDTLITQMVSTAVLHRKFRLASEIMQTYPDVLRDYPDRMAAITSPILPEHANLGRALAGEFRFAASVHKDLKHAIAHAPPGNNLFDRISKPLISLGAYQPNATVNQAYARHLESAAFYANPPKQILGGYQALAEKNSQLNWWNPALYLYNPVGRILLSASTADVSRYAFRLHDLVGYSRLIELQRRIAQAGISMEMVPAYLARAEPNLADPYSEQPVGWHAASRTISFGGYGERYLKNGRVQVELGDRGR